MLHCSRLDERLDEREECSRVERCTEVLDLEEGNWNNGMGRLEYRLGGDWNIGWGKTRHNSQSTGVEDVWQRQW